VYETVFDVITTIKTY